MKKSEEELSIKMLNNEFKRVFAQPLGIRETALRLRECIDGIDDDFTEVDNFKLSFSLKNHFLFVFLFAIDNANMSNALNKCFL